MNEIRFNSQNPNPTPSPSTNPIFPAPESLAKPKTQKRIGKKKLLVLFFAVVLVALAFIFGPVVKNLIESKLFSARSEQFSAVFLTNGQVYFGEIRDISKDEIILENVYYLQAGGEGSNNIQGEAINQTFRLIKLGDELHGPTDELFVNREHVVFYEYLREDSKVVESIRKK